MALVTFLLFSEEKLQVREFTPVVGGGGWEGLPLVVFLGAGARGSFHSSMLHPQSDPCNSRVERVVGVTK